MVGRLYGRGKIGHRTHKYHRGKGEYSRHEPSRDAKIVAKRKLKKMYPRGGTKRRRLYRHVADISC